MEWAALIISILALLIALGSAWLSYSHAKDPHGHD